MGTLLGVKLEVDHMRIATCIPAPWEPYKIRYRYRETVYHITVRRVGEKSAHVSRVTLDGALIDVADPGGAGRPQGKMITRVDDRREYYFEVGPS